MTVQVMGLNVDGAHPALNCLKSHENRNSPAVTKGCDEQAIVIHGGHADEAPRTVKLYVNRDVDFESAEAAVATHVISMPSTMSDEAEFPLSLAKFNNVGSLSLFVSDNFGGDVCRLQYVGFKGTFLAPKVRVGAIKNAVYEAKPQVQDHKVKDEAAGLSRGL